MAPIGPFKLVTVNTAPDRAKRLIGRVVEDVKEQYTIIHAANAACKTPTPLPSAIPYHPSQLPGVGAVSPVRQALHLVLPLTPEASQLKKLQAQPYEENANFCALAIDDVQSIVEENQPDILVSINQLVA